MRSILLILFLSPFAVADEDLNHDFKACFYKDSQQNSRPLCFAAGEKASWLADPEWNDKITNVTVPEGLEVTLYKNDHFNHPSAKITTNIDLAGLRELDLENAVSSVKVRTVAKTCLFEDANYLGGRICLGAAESVEWSDQDYLNNKISSIKVPEGLQVKIYRDHENDMKFLTLSEDMDVVELTSLDMQDNISRVVVEHAFPIPCNFVCAIRQHFALPLAQMYGSAWNDPRLPYKYIALNFIQNPEQDYTVTLSPHVKIEIKPQTATLVHDARRIEYPLSPNISHFAIMLMRASIAEQMQQIQFLEVNNTLYLNSSLIFDVWEIENMQQQELRVDNHSATPLVLYESIVAASRSPIRPQRNLDSGKILCFFNPVMALYNYLVQGQCNQPKHLVNTLSNYLTRDNNDRTLFKVAGRAEPFAADTSVPALTESLPEFHLSALSLRRNMPPLSIFSAARTCEVDITDVLASRKKRGVDNNDCIYWTLDVITLYTLLFGSDSDSTWNSEHFGRMVDNILRTDSTGYAVSGPDLELERQLIQAVKEQAEALDDIGRRSKRAFDYAQLAWADYVLDHTTLEQAEESNEVVHQEPQYAPIASPQEIQTTHLLGTYVLHVDEYVARSVVPRILQSGQWVEDPEKEFEVEIVRRDSSQFSTVLPIIDSWERTYNNRLVTHPDSSFLHATEAIATLLQMELASSPNPYLNENIYLIVRLKGSGEPLSILSAQSRDNEITIRASISAPQNVLLPYGEGAIRGAGSFAVASLAQYAKDNAYKFIISHVVSQPSAAVKKKIGFKFVDEFR